LAAICCAAPLLAVTLATAGLTAWLAKGAYVLIPALLVCLALVAYRLNHRRSGTSTRSGSADRSSQRSAALDFQPSSRSFQESDLASS
jgi:mercuric ion transport protein